MSAMPRWVLPAGLAASLLLNLALGGFIAGAHLRPDGPPPPKAGEDRPMGERPAELPELSREDRREVRMLMRAAFETAEAELEARRAAERRLAEVIGSQPFDRQAADDAFDALRAADERLRQRIGAGLIDGLDALNADQRAWVAHILADRRDGHRGRRGGENGRSPPREKPAD
ncbi:periplasmic heavy metal sensor [Hyphomonas sp.]|uniref:periplasmic heavy metal sensor n=1 Tax=Hyphomonas sp. TaxID=87 RepID=UPI00391D1C5D